MYVRPFTRPETAMTRTTQHLLDPAPDPRGASLSAAIWDGKTGTVIETSRKLPHNVQQG